MNKSKKPVRYSFFNNQLDLDAYKRNGITPPSVDKLKYSTSVPKVNYEWSFVCFMSGHKPVKKLVEDTVAIYTSCCERCGKPFMKIGETFIKPPDTTDNDWKQFMKGRKLEFINKYSEL